MIQLIVGKKGKGKTKQLLDKVNREVKEISGNIVYLDKSTKHMYELNNKVRLIDVSQFMIESSNEFLGFVSGIISQDHDLQQMYFDSFLKIACLDDSDITWIYFYNSKGEVAIRFKTTMSQFGYPVDISLSPNSNLAMVSYIAEEEGAVRSSVAFYNFGEVGQNEVDNYMSGYNYPSVVPYVSFMTSELAFAVADDRLAFYEGAQKPVSKSEVMLEGEVRSVYHNETYVALVSYDTTGGSKYVINVYDSTGKNCLSQGFDTEYRNVVLKGENIYIYGEAECCIYNLSGVEKFNGTMDTSISLLLPGDSVRKFTLVGQDSIDEIELN